MTTNYNYDGQGRVISIYDPNDAGTFIAYFEGDGLGDRIHTQTSAAGTTEYNYDADAGTLNWVHHPSGTYEVYSYVNNGAPTERLQWKATCADPGGTSCSERTEYTYYTTGALDTEKVEDSTGAIRIERKHQPDLRGRPTYEKVGSGSGSYSLVKVFDAQSRMAGQSTFAFPGSPAFCGGLDTTQQPIDVAKLCSHFAYDNLNRLSQVDTFPQPTSADGRTLIRYTPSGNITSIATGCSTAGGTCNPVATYSYDDFGQMIRMWGAGLPDSNSYQYEYDASGNVTKKQTPSMVDAGQYLAYEYDGLGRELSATFVGGSTNGGVDPLLYRFSYDRNPYQDTNADSNCQSTNAEGRLAVRLDSFGKSFYSYDVLGNVVAIQRERLGREAAGCTAPQVHTDDNPNSEFNYLPDGRLSTEVYPHGRAVHYDYYAIGGLNDRIQQVRVDNTDGSSGGVLVGSIQWEPYGGIRSYVIADAATAPVVEYLQGDSWYTVPGSCSAARPGIPDSTGRLRGIFVSSSGRTDGNLFRKMYSWSGDQLSAEATCTENTTATPWIAYYGRAGQAFNGTDSSGGYDRTLRLTDTSRPAQDFTTKGGPWGKRSYAYDGRGNRETEVADSWIFTYDAGLADHLSSRSVRLDSCTNPNGCAAVCHSGSCPQTYSYETRYDYDDEGRVSKVSWLPASADAGFVSTQEFDATPDTAHGALGAVYRTVKLDNSFTYSYFYDADGRRWLKQYPDGTKDEFYYEGTQLIEDRGNSAGILADGGTDPAPGYTLDEYVWVGGRPVAMLKTAFDNAWNRPVVDSAGDCRRSEQAWAPPAPSASGTCGHFFPITDYIGKPVAMLDSAGRVAGTGEYDPYGNVNRVTYIDQAPGQGIDGGVYQVVGYLNVSDAGSNLAFSMRGRFSSVDTASDAVLRLTDGNSTNGTVLAAMAGQYDASGQQIWTATASGPLPLGRMTTPWATAAPGKVHVEFKTGNQTVSHTGVTFEGYDYFRYDINAVPTWTPLGLPGQYADTETDLRENWNRFYDPSTGRYLAPEPLFANPSYVAMRTESGGTVATYAYASNNPIVMEDPTGLAETDGPVTCTKGGGCTQEITVTPDEPDDGQAQREANFLRWAGTGALLRNPTAVTRVISGAELLGAGALTIIAGMSADNAGPAINASLPPFPAPPNGWSQSKLGKFLKWPELRTGGGGFPGGPPPSWAEILAAGLTADYIRRLVDFYNQVAAALPGNPSAAARVTYLTDILSAGH